jgi:ribonuclease BN (tRNA processing enzyme)
MKLTVLGKFGPYPAPGGACSGYLVEDGDTRVLLDCGNGVISRLQQICPFDQLTAVVLSHLHSDHMSDMMVLRYALDIMVSRGMREDKPLRVYTPENPKKEFDRIPYKSVYDVNPIHEGMQIQIGSLLFHFREMTHPIQSFGMDISNGEKRIVYTGDTGYNPLIEKMAEGADFFFADTGVLSQHKTGSYVPHLTADEAGRIAAKAGVKQFMITHLWPGYDEREVAREVSRHYPGVIVAQEMQEYQL